MQIERTEDILGESGIELLVTYIQHVDESEDSLVQSTVDIDITYIELVIGGKSMYHTDESNGKKKKTADISKFMTGSQMDFIRDLLFNI
jgi:hypothetical protein